MQEGQKTNPTKRLTPLALVLILSALAFLALLGFGFAKLSREILQAFSHEIEFDGDWLDQGLKGEQNALALLDLKGEIHGARKFIQRLHRAERDDRIAGIVVRINSPGGAVAPSQEIYQAIRESKKPLYVSMGSLAASGGFYAAMGAKKIFANPGTLTGSIGVVMSFQNMERLYEWAKIEPYVIKSGAHKDFGSPARKMTHEEKALLQETVDEVLAQFKAAILSERKITEEELRRVADGRVFSGSKAKALQLVDELGSLEDTITSLANDLDMVERPKVIHFGREKMSVRDWLDWQQTGDSDGSQESKTLLDSLATRFIGEKRPPGMYMLWTGHF
jgi:protease IV